MEKLRFQMRHLGELHLQILRKMNYPGFLDFSKKWIGAMREWSPSTLQTDICDVETFCMLKDLPSGSLESNRRQGSVCAHGLSMSAVTT